MTNPKFLKNLIKESAREAFGDFDFSKSATGNSTYHNVSNDLYQLSSKDSLPVNIDNTSDWEYVDDYTKTSLNKDFEFKSMKSVLFFVNEVLEKAEEIHHHPILTLDHYTVNVQLTTVSVNDVTARDLDLSKYIDEVNNDIKYIEGL